MQTPGGVRAVSIFYWALCAACALGAIALFLTRQSDSLVGAALGPALMQAGAFVAVLLLVFAVLYGALAWGLWRARTWAHSITLILTAVLGLFSLVGVLLSLWLDVVGVIVNGVIFWYMAQPRTRRTFA